MVASLERWTVILQRRCHGTDGVGVLVQEEKEQEPVARFVIVRDGHWRDALKRAGAGKLRVHVETVTFFRSTVSIRKV